MFSDSQSTINVAEEIEWIKTIMGLNFWPSKFAAKRTIQNSSEQMNESRRYTISSSAKTESVVFTISFQSHERQIKTNSSFQLFKI